MEGSDREGREAKKREKSFENGKRTCIDRTRAPGAGLVTGYRSTLQEKKLGAEESPKKKKSSLKEKK